MMAKLPKWPRSSGLAPRIKVWSHSISTPRKCKITRRTQLAHEIRWIWRSWAPRKCPDKNWASATEPVRMTRGVGCRRILIRLHFLEAPRSYNRSNKGNPMFRSCSTLFPRAPPHRANKIKETLPSSPSPSPSWYTTEVRTGEWVDWSRMRRVRWTRQWPLLMLGRVGGCHHLGWACRRWVRLGDRVSAYRSLVFLNWIWSRDGVKTSTKDSKT